MRRVKRASMPPSATPAPTRNTPRWKALESAKSWPAISATTPMTTATYSRNAINRTSRQFRSAFEEGVDLVEPARGARVAARAVLRADRVDHAQELALALGQADRGLDHHVAEQLAGL